MSKVVGSLGKGCTKEPLQSPLCGCNSNPGAKPVVNDGATG